MTVAQIQNIHTIFRQFEKTGIGGGVLYKYIGNKRQHETGAQDETNHAQQKEAFSFHFGPSPFPKAPLFMSRHPKTEHK